jgi:hypothetical protein
VTKEIQGPADQKLLPSCVVLGPSWACLGAILVHVGLSWGHVGAILGCIEAILGIEMMPHSLVAPGKKGPADDGKRSSSDGRCIRDASRREVF